jgi:hypothetical protein
MDSTPSRSGVPAMARYLIAAGVLLLTVAAIFSAPAPESDRDVKAIIARALEAKGGAANVEKYRSFTSKFVGREGEEATFVGTSLVQAPDKAILKETTTLGGTQIVEFTQVVSGDKGWQSVNGSTSELDTESLAEVREDIYANCLAKLHGLNAKGVAMSTLGESKVNDKDTFGVKVSCAGHYDVKLYFGKEKALLLKMERSTKENGIEHREEKLYEEYRNISGVMVPFKITIKRDDRLYLTMEMTEVNLLEKLPDSTFAKP